MNKKNVFICVFFTIIFSASSGIILSIISKQFGIVNGLMVVPLVGGIVGMITFNFFNCFFPIYKEY